MEIGYMEKAAFQIGGKKDYSTNGAGTFELPSEKKNHYFAPDLLLQNNFQMDQKYIKTHGRIFKK